MRLFSFCNFFCLLFRSFVFSALSLSLSRVCSLRVHISLLWQHSGGVIASLARSLARTHKIDRQTERAKDTQQTDKRGSGEAEVEDFFYYKCAMCSRIIIEQRQEEQASEQGGGGGGGVLVGRSFGLLFS